MEKCPVMGFEPSMHRLQGDAHLLSKVFKALDFMPDQKVDRFMPVVIDVVIDCKTLMFCCRRTKSLIRTEANFRTFYLL